MVLDEGRKSGFMFPRAHRNNDLPINYQLSPSSHSMCIYRSYTTHERRPATPIDIQSAAHSQRTNGKVLPVSSLPGQENRSCQNCIGIRTRKVVDGAMQTFQRNPTMIVGQIFGLRVVSLPGDMGSGKGEDCAHDKIVA